MHILLKTILLVCVTALVTSCAIRDREHKVLISIPEQKMIVFKNDIAVATYDVSTSKFGLGNSPGSRATPLGSLEVARKIGAHAASGAVFKGRKRTGEILAVDAPGRDPVVTRILWLKGMEPANRNAFKRYIYIHGTPEEKTIGTPASYGCIRMRSRDVIDLYETIGIGAKVEILNDPISYRQQTSTSG